MRIEIRMFRSKTRGTLAAARTAFRAEIERTLNEIVKPYFIKQFEEIVDNWKNKPQFNAMKTISADKIELYIEAFGPNAQLWNWTSRGTKPHLITAKRAPFLRFKGDYVAKTIPGPDWGGPGKAIGPWVSKKAVKHPGTKARKFEEYITKENRPWWKKTMEAAMKRALRR